MLSLRMSEARVESMSSDYAVRTSLPNTYYEASRASTCSERHRHPMVAL